MTTLVSPTSTEVLVMDKAGALIGSLHCEVSTGLLVGTWLGYCSPEAVRHGVEAALPLVPGCWGLLSDGSRAQGDWSELLPWLVFDYLPRLRTAGITHLASVPSQVEVRSQFIHVQYARYAPDFMDHFGVFTDVATARAWLLSSRAGRQQ